jgi:hypothetical protein
MDQPLKKSALERTDLDLAAGFGFACIPPMETKDLRVMGEKPDSTTINHQVRDFSQLDDASVPADLTGRGCLIFKFLHKMIGVKQILRLPRQVVPLCIVALGYPATKPELPVSRYDETRLHHNHW